MVNAIDQIWTHAKRRRTQTAFWLPGQGATSFGDLMSMARGIQGTLAKGGIKPGDAVLVQDSLGPRLYASLIALLGLGAACVFLEPWMPLARMQSAIEATKPKAFLTSWTGRLWAMRIGAIRSIPSWISIGTETHQQRLHVEDMPENAPAIVNFTRGFSGTPKAVSQTHGTLIEQNQLLGKLFLSESHEGPDLCIFPQYALANLAWGRTSLLVPPHWRDSALSSLDSLPINLQPDTLTCGPGFLLRLMQAAHVHTLQSIHIGGALSDCWIFEQGFTCWPHARWLHLYGSREAEPVAVADARQSVAECRKRNYFQLLSLGAPVEGLEYILEEDRLWIRGPHVCDGTYGDTTISTSKRRDKQGQVWHEMGDRILSDEQGWWYAGRTTQEPEHFQLEQAVYEFLQNSSSFIHCSSSGDLFLVGEKLESNRNILRKKFPQLTDIVDCNIYRDTRHRAAIDRITTIRKGAPWLDK